MRFKNLDNWDSNFRHDGLLYFTQRVQEMLSNRSTHIYKTPVMNTYLLIDEYLNTATLVKNGTLKDVHLKYIMEEFLSTFTSDIIINEYYPADIKSDIIKKLKSSSLQEQEKIMRYLKHIFADYNFWCKEYIKYIVAQPKEKKKIEKGLRSLIPGLIGAGYSKDYIYHYNQRVFQKNVVSSLSALDTFLDRFDFMPRTYEVYFAINRYATRFQDILTNRLNLKFCKADDHSDLKFNRRKYCLASLSIQAYDERAATIIAYHQLNLFFRYYNYFNDQKSEWLFTTAKVVNEEHHVAIIDIGSEFLNNSPRDEREPTGQASEAIITMLLSRSQQSFRTIDKAVNMHNVATASKDPKTTFLNLWSVFEILFVTDQSGSKITEIEQKVIPILKKDYFHYLVNLIEENLKHNLPADAFEELANSIKPNINFEKWIAALIFSPEFDDQRKGLYKNLENCPLIRSRISQLNSDFSDKKQLMNVLDQYVIRIRWHLRRLYRTRNAIIHSGESPLQLKELSEHLHSYVDECLLEILGILSYKPQLYSINDVIIDIQLQEEKIKRCMQAKDKITSSDIPILFEWNVL